MEAGPPLVAAAQHLEHLELGVREAVAAGVAVELAGPARQATRSSASVARLREVGARRPPSIVSGFIISDGTTPGRAAVKPRRAR